MSRLKFINNTWHAEYMNEETIRSAMEYKPHPGDVFICTFSKCGTNWMHTIVNYILTKGGPLPFKIGVADTFFEFVGKEAIEERPPPRVIPNHFKFEDIPYSTEAKYIIVLRNPKDACVSFYHHLLKVPSYGMVIDSFDQFVDNYIKGYVPFGSYFDYMLSWYKHKDENNVLFLTYEGIKEDTRKAILQVADFLGPEYAEVFKDESVLQTVLNGCSLPSMFKELSASLKKVEDSIDEVSKVTNTEKGLQKVIEVCNIDTPEGEKKQLFDPRIFVRKGEVGGWRDLFTDELSRKMEEKFLEAIKGTGMKDLWKDVKWMTTVNQN